MANIHPSAILEGDVSLADDVIVGPNCVLTGPIELGPGTKLIGSVYLNGPISMGANNVVYPFTCLGFAPQHTKFDPATPGQGLRIGSHNTFREQVSIHRAFQPEHPTTIGDRNYFMIGAHAGHDCAIANDCTIVAGAMMGGHAIIEDKVIVGGHASVHQFCRVGQGAMVGGGLAMSNDLPPYFLLTGINVTGAVNIVGLRRSGFTHEQIDTVRWVYRTLYRSGLTMSDARERVAERAGDPMIDTYLHFFGASKRPICRGAGQKGRGTADAVEME